MEVRILQRLISNTSNRVRAVEENILFWKEHYGNWRAKGMMHSVSDCSKIINYHKKLLKKLVETQKDLKKQLAFELEYIRMDKWENTND